MSVCETRDLAVGYRDVVQEDIGLEARRGRILGIIGPNGAGKSTLLKTLAGQLAPKGGQILLDGKELAAYGAAERAGKLALFLPMGGRSDYMSCFDAAAMGRYPYTGRLGILSLEDRKIVHRALQLVGAESLAERDFTKISDGQRQRILLARAICQTPVLLLLDEPMSFLDIKGKVELMKILKTLAHEENMAIVLTLHELSLARSLADDVISVGREGVSRLLPPEEAFSKENICRLFEITQEEYLAYM